MSIRYSLGFLFLFLHSFFTYADEAQPQYAPAKVVYDITSGNLKELENILDRVSFLQNLYNNNSFEASIILVIHSEAIPQFAKHNKLKNNPDGKRDELIKRARSLTLGEIIQFRICEASAKIQGYKKKDFHEFTQLVPMADAEIIMLQDKGYAFMR